MVSCKGVFEDISVGKLDTDNPKSLTLAFSKLILLKISRLNVHKVLKLVIS
jgi:hypothetical protein